LNKKINIVKNYFTENKNIKTFSNEPLSVYTDGGTKPNPGLCVCGYVIIDHQDEVIADRVETIGYGNNLQAEYGGVRLALEDAPHLTSGPVNIYTDNYCVYNQLNGMWQIHKDYISKIHEELRSLEQMHHGTISYNWVRGNNPNTKKIDAMCTSKLKKIYG